MISGSRALLRQLHSFMEESGLPWDQIKIRADHSDDGSPFVADDHVVVYFKHNNKEVSVVIYAPSDTPSPYLKGKLIPCGWLVGKTGEQVVSGILDVATWNKITQMIKEGKCPN